jgi:hypothetical protein
MIRKKLAPLQQAKKLVLSFSDADKARFFNWYLDLTGISQLAGRAADTLARQGNQIIDDTRRHRDYEDLLHFMHGKVKRSRTAINQRNDRAVRRRPIIAEQLSLGVTDPVKIFEEVKRQDPSSVFATSNGKREIDPASMMKDYNRHSDNGRNPGQRP